MGSTKVGVLRSTKTKFISLILIRARASLSRNILFPTACPYLNRYTSVSHSVGISVIECSNLTTMAILIA